MPVRNQVNSDWFRIRVQTWSMVEATLKTDLILAQPSMSPAYGAGSSIEINQIIADQMEALSIELRSMVCAPTSQEPTPISLLALSKKVYSARRKVDDIFGMDGFAVSPGWDIMLDLYGARARGARISVTSACIGGACPATTGLRWLQALDTMGLIEREGDPRDKRRAMVSLTASGVEKVEQALSAYA